jgi:uncharacterized protein
MLITKLVKNCLTRVSKNNFKEDLLMNKKFMKAFITMFCVIVMFSMSVVTFAAPNIPSPTSDFYVNDFAGVFTEDEKSDLVNRAVELANTYEGVQVVITTIDSLDGITVEDYANAMYNEYGIGKDDMGLLILLSTGDRKIRVEVGKKMEAHINDSKAGRFLDKYAIPKLKENKFNEGLISLQKELITEIKASIDKEKQPTVTSEPAMTKEPIEIDWGGVIIFLLIVLVLGIFAAIAWFIHKQSNIIKMKDEKISELNTRIRAVQELNTARIEATSRELKNTLKEKEKIETKYSSLKNQFNTLEDRFRRAKVLVPGLEAKIDNMIEEEIKQQDMAKAASVDALVNKVIGLTPTKEVIPQLEEALNAYDMLSKKQRTYVKADINKLNSLYKEATEIKYKHLAFVATNTIIPIISAITIGKEKHIRDLEKAKGTYDQLHIESKKYVDKEIPDRISELLTQAKKDKRAREEREEEERRKRREEEERRRRREEEERRRRNSSSSSYSSFGGGSHSGFGGRSGGGGASRGF